MIDAIARHLNAGKYRKRILAVFLTPIVLVGTVRWMIAAPLDAAGSYPADVGWLSGPDPDPESETVAEAELLDDTTITWPSDSLEGAEANRLLTRALGDLVGRLRELASYEAIICRRERVGGRWLSEQTLRMKVRHRPMSVYMKDIGRPSGCEIIYVDGLRKGRLISHPGGGLIGMLLPPVELDPYSSLAMSQSRFPITEAGVLPVSRMLLDASRRDQDDPDASITLDRVVDDEGRTLYRSISRYASPSADRPFARVEVRFDPETLLLCSYSFHEWPETPGDEPALAGRYIIESFDPSVSLGDLDFDPLNPSYNFR